MVPRKPYHHGDLRNALVQAAAQLASRGGPEAVTVRAAAREVGVTPTAAYRHFAGHEELFMAAKEEATSRLADAMRARLAVVAAEDDPVEHIQARLAAIGRGYLDFALAEPGLYQTAFGRDAGLAMKDDSHLSDPEHPHGMLMGEIEALIRLGALPEDDRTGIELTAWGLVHGLALLMIDGPFVGASTPEKEAMVNESLRVFRRMIWSPSGRD
ncbi:TetR/AcrR family transcriptional regulator [Luteipulveratus flavus]|uniref:TetR/AcrR family transcriptional regulator n=1 Tax=Luteipulveratus flavus TaxID=3031728 RepID=A0ABT6C5P6_9MICO|nr:TetR/AcrR family transcriptional regulator [Luteipulveratus sp. YIM 133296]MDF8263622.1 TetR/AcrR family transcriptional regulator [Luteipulveratus sp. YIM 133296]